MIVGLSNLGTFARRLAEHDRLWQHGPRLRDLNFDIIFNQATSTTKQKGLLGMLVQNWWCFASLRTTGTHSSLTGQVSKLTSSRWQDLNDFLKSVGEAYQNGYRAWILGHLDRALLNMEDVWRLAAFTFRSTDYERFLIENKELATHSMLFFIPMFLLYLSSIHRLRASTMSSHKSATHEREIAVSRSVDADDSLDWMGAAISVSKVLVHMHTLEAWRTLGDPEGVVAAFEHDLQHHARDNGRLFNADNLELVRQCYFMIPLPEHFKVA